MKDWFNHYRATIAFVFIVAVTAFLFWRQNVEQEERRAFDATRDYDSCVFGNEFRKELTAVMRGMTEDLIASAQDNPEPGDGDNTAAISAYRARTERRLKPLAHPRDCKALLISNIEGP